MLLPTGGVVAPAVRERWIIAYYRVYRWPPCASSIRSANSSCKWRAHCVGSLQNLCTQRNSQTRAAGNPRLNNHILTACAAITSLRRVPKRETGAPTNPILPAQRPRQYSPISSTGGVWLDEDEICPMPALQLRNAVFQSNHGVAQPFELARRPRFARPRCRDSPDRERDRQSRQTTGPRGNGPVPPRSDARSAPAATSAPCVECAWSLFCIVTRHARSAPRACH